jgi:hypothetical protein
MRPHGPGKDDTHWHLVFASCVQSSSPALYLTYLLIRHNFRAQHSDDLCVPVQSPRTLPHDYPCDTLWRELELQLKPGNTKPQQSTSDIEIVESLSVVTTTENAMAITRKK